ncbi:uncharacterized protein LOC114875682 [Osmia bicornis bicornis]|uniref:uncharacterized protein LOC114875682 n=1 Tax=Osmia bicornis bicornis TaxID=1437191 RepID=UPI001EAE8492|nr:uncharacterized protein LOC114875682 [Osmia bicornis bicornis]
MFYSRELLSYRRRGKLAKCWLAATLSEKMFRKRCRPHLLETIDVSNICEEISVAVEVRNGNSNGRFSLYLSAQLLYGITRIHSYQTKLFEGIVFIFNRPEEEFDLRDIPDVPCLNEVFQNLEISSNLHLITEEPYTSAVEQMMRDEINFGFLPDHEMEKFIFLGGGEQSLSEVRRIPWNVSEEAIKEPDVPLVNIDMFEIEEEIRSGSARINQQEFIVTLKDDPLTKVSTFPRKRSMKPTEEISPKRRKTRSEEETVPAIPEPIPLPQPTTDTVPAIELQQDQVQQPPEDEEFIEAVKPKRKRKIYDEYVALSDAVMKKNTGNVTAHTIKHHRFTATLPPAKVYLTQPSTVTLDRSWGKPLMRLFKQHIVGPFVVENEFQATDMEIEETIETLRANESKLRDQTGEISSKIGTIINGTTDQSRVFDKTPLNIAIDATDQSKILDKTLPTIGQPPQLEDQQTERKEESTVALPEITYIEDKNGELQEKQQKSTNGRKSKSNSSSPRSEIHLSKQELLAFMEVQWQERRLLNFHELFSPESYSRKEVALAFFFCLEFQKEKVIILKQADPFGTIWIEKCPCYS